MAYRLKKRDKKKVVLVRLLLALAVLLMLALVVWLIWLRPVQQQNNIDNFEECKATGYPIQESYPEVCVVPNGKRFVSPAQQSAHQSSLLGDQTVASPSDSSQLNLDIEEWGVRVPLTEQTFDLIYAYFEDGATERVTFNFKRLVNAGACQSDAGLTLTRSALLRQPPFSETNPAPVAQVKNYYFYMASSIKPCYDPNNSGHTDLAHQIAGDKTLPVTINLLLRNLSAVP
jgi:hypothetical protein